METNGSRFFDFLAPHRDMIHLDDILRGLSKTCRFGGHINAEHYSVAEHACLVRRFVVEAGYPALGLPALHHDTHETYLGDLPTPLKNALKMESPAYEAMAAALDDVIAQWLGIDPELFHHPVVVGADQLALRVEAAVLKDSRGITGEWPWRELPELPKDWHPGLSASVAATEFVRAHDYEMMRAQALSIRRRR